MTQKIFFIFFVCIIHIFLIALEAQANDNYIDLMIEPSSNIVFVEGEQDNLLFGFGIRLHGILENNIGFNGIVYAGKNYFEISPGIVGIPWGLLSIWIIDQWDSLRFNSFEEMVFFVSVFIAGFPILLVSLLENPSYTISIGNHLKLTLYISFCRIRYYYNDNVQNTNFTAMGSAGIKIDIYLIKNFFLSIFTAGNLHYNQKEPLSYIGGLSLGFKLDNVYRYN